VQLLAHDAAAVAHPKSWPSGGKGQARDPRQGGKCMLRSQARSIGTVRLSYLGGGLPGFPAVVAYNLPRVLKTCWRTDRASESQSLARSLTRRLISEGLVECP